MPRVRITSAAYNAVRQHAEPDMKPGVRLPSGEWEVILQHNTMDGLRRVAHPGESLSDTIERICATTSKKLN
jgi:hypothetical protein